MFTKTGVKNIWLHHFVSQPLKKLHNAPLNGRAKFMLEQKLGLR